MQGRGILEACREYKACDLVEGGGDKVDLCVLYLFKIKSRVTYLDHDNTTRPWIFCRPETCDARAREGFLCLTGHRKRTTRGHTVARIRIKEPKRIRLLQGGCCTSKSACEEPNNVSVRGCTVW